MLKRIVLATLAVFVAWSALDLLIHGGVLGSTYERTASLWRPEEEMKMVLMYIVTLVVSFAFVFIYARFFGRKGLLTGVQYGLWFGIAMGISMGYGTYSVMPIPYVLAISWFLATLVQAVVAGLITGAIVRE